MRSHGTSLHLGGSATLSVTDGCLWRDGDGTSMRFRVPQQVVNIAHIPKLNKPRDGSASGGEMRGLFEQVFR
jgi:hypothetical protein